jgi:DNA-binding CsgD family transcriptional regulator
MKRLDARDVSALLAFVSDLKDVDDFLAFPPRVLAGLGRLIPANSVHYSELDPATRTSVLQVAFAEGAEEVSWGDDGDEFWWQLRPTHPLCCYRSRSGNWTQPLKVSDFATQVEFRRTKIYDALYRGDLDYWLDVGLPATPTKTRVFIFIRRGGTDFTERDRLVLDFLRPHLEARATAAEAAGVAASSLAALEEHASEEARRIVLCSVRGKIEFASPSSRALLARYLRLDNGRVPASLLGRPRLVFEDGTGALTIRVARSGKLCVLLLDERDTRVDRLTTREREVLESVARGQANGQIALELGIAPATVAKHLEHVYEKLGVASRTAAAALVSA